MSNNDSNVVAAEHKANELPDGFDWLGIAKHFAKHTALELAKLQDAIGQVKRDEITQGYKSGFVQLDALGNGVIELKNTTKTVILQKQGGYLDGTKVILGDFTFTYPSKEVEIDCLHLPTFSEKFTLQGNAGDSYVVTQSSIPDLLLSDVVKGFSNLNGSVQVTNTPNVQLSGSNLPYGQPVKVASGSAGSGSQNPQTANIGEPTVRYKNYILAFNNTTGVAINSVTPVAYQATVDTAIANPAVTGSPGPGNPTNGSVYFTEASGEPYLFVLSPTLYFVFNMASVTSTGVINWVLYGYN